MKRRSFFGAGLAGLGASFLAAEGRAFQFIPKPSQEKWAVVFGTWYGTARDAAVWISEGMGGIASVFDARRGPDLKAYDHLVLGTAIQGGKGTKELEALIQEYGSDIKLKTRALFVVCGNRGETPGPDQVKTYIDDYLAKLCGLESPLRRVFGGRITKGLLSEQDYKGLEGFHESMNKPFVDYDHLSRLECLGFGKEIRDKTPSR